MILQPVLNVFLLLLLCAPVAFVAVLGLRAAKKGDKGIWILRLTVILAVFVMLLRPGIPEGSVQTLATDTDVVLVVDTTASIVAEDWDGDKPRLEGVRADVQTITDAYPGARFALITFDADARLRLPLTTDTSALATSLDVLTPEVTNRSVGSSIDIAADLVSKTLSDAAKGSPNRSRMVFYFGDGEQTSRSVPIPFSASKKNTDGGAVLGYGTEAGGPMKLTTGDVNPASDGYIEYQGKRAVSTIDERNLKRLAEQFGVEYQHRTADNPLTLAPSPSRTTSYTESSTIANVTELYWIPAFLVIALLGIELARAGLTLARLRQHVQRPSLRKEAGDEHR